MKIDRGDEAAGDRAAPGRRRVDFGGRLCGRSGRGLSPPRGCAGGRCGAWCRSGRPGCRGACGGASSSSGPSRESTSVGEPPRPPLDHVPGGVEAADRHVLRVAGQGRRGDQADQLGLERAGAERRRQLPHPLDHLAQRHRQRVVDVGRDLGAAAGERQADRPHAGQAAAGLAQPGGDRAGDLDVAAVELDVEGGQRRAGGDQGRAGACGAAGRARGRAAALPPPSAARARPGRRCGSRRARRAPGRVASSP